MSERGRSDPVHKPVAHKPVAHKPVAHKETARGGEAVLQPDLREATATTLRALAQDAEVQVQFSVAETAATYQPQSAGEVQMPGPPNSSADLDSFRGTADRLAFWRCHHDSALDAIARPTDVAAEVHELWWRLEQVRVETHGSRFLQGCRQNMATCELLELQQESTANADTLCQPVATAALLRSLLSDTKPDAGLSRQLRHLTPALKQLAGSTRACLDDQKAFAASALDFLRELDLVPPEKADEPQPEPDEEEGGPQSEAVSEQDGDDSPSEGEGEESMEDEMGGDSASVIADGEMVESDEEDAAGDLSQLEQQLLQQGSAYQVYCNAYDRIIAPSDLCSSAELRALRAQLDQLAQPCMGLVNKLAARLRRLIMANQQRRWEHDLEDGILDAKRLSRIVVSPLRIPPHKKEQTQEFRSTAVSLLIDNSGSQRGKAIALAAVTAEIVASTLEKCGVRTEILGFTTGEWKGGQSRKRWQADKRPSAPGRLNDLLHIEYKAASTSWRRMRRDLGLMLLPELLKENIDGEALIWAHDRLLALPEDRRILMVISDGAPVDDSTLSTNAPGYLDAHLRQVVQGIEQLGLVELIAIGIGHDVGRYYRHAVTLHRPEDLGTAVLEQLTALFAKKS